MKTLSALFVPLALVALPALASQERTHFAHTITMSADTGDPFGEITVEIKTGRDKTNPKIQSIRMMIGGKWKTVPAKAYADLDSPMLHKTEIRTEPGMGRGPWLYIYFEVVHYDAKGKWHTRKVHIAWLKDRFEYRSVSIPKPDGSSKWEKLDL
jgi:hypothetical protein